MICGLVLLVSILNLVLLAAYKSVYDNLLNTVNLLVNFLYATGLAQEIVYSDGELILLQHVKDATTTTGGERDERQQI